jgi:hypothetical protein
VLRKLVGDEDQWGWAEQQARLLMRHLRICGQSIGLETRRSLLYRTVQLAAEQTLADIGTFEAEKATKR